MSDTVNARGLSCPQPVILTQKKMAAMGKGVFEVLVDTETSKENISRLAQNSGWQIDVERSGEDYRLVLKKE